MQVNIWQRFEDWITSVDLSFIALGYFILFVLCYSFLVGIY